MINYDAEIAKLDNQLAELYRGGSVDTLQKDRLWLRINQLEKEKADSLDSFIMEDYLPVID